MKISQVKIVLITVALVSVSSVSMAQKKKPAQVVDTGENFSCSFTPQKDESLPNYLRIKASKRTDVAVRLIDKKTDECVRYAFINQGSSYDIANVPEGKYYVKVALGKEWIFEDSSKCAGSFKQNSIYKKINKTFDFSNKGSKKNPQVPIYELDLDVTTKGSHVADEAITVKEFQK